MPSRTIMAAALLVAVGCTGADEPLTYTEQAQIACRQIDRSLQAIPVPSTAAQFDIWLTRTAEENRKGTQRLRDLDPGPGIQAAASELVEASEAATEGFEAYARAYRAKSERGKQRALRAINVARQRYADAAKDLGLTTCIPPSPLPSS